MNKFACRYALIQFVPYAETGEFANIGVLLVCPKTGFFGFKLETAKYQRYTHFFKDVTQNIYRDAVKIIDMELKRIQTTSLITAPEQLLNVFTAVTHPRAAIIRFSEPRGRLVDSPAKALDDLFHHYVEFGFLHEQTPEEKLEARIHDLLNGFKLISPFREGIIGAENDVSVRLPLIQTINDVPIKAIKPLFLGQKKPNEIFNHGEFWVGRFRRLKRDVGWEGKMLVTVDGLSQDAKFRKLQNTIINDLSEFVTVQDVNQTDAIESFCLQ